MPPESPVVSFLREKLRDVFNLLKDTSNVRHSSTVSDLECDKQIDLYSTQTTGRGKNNKPN